MPFDAIAPALPLSDLPPVNEAISSSQEHDLIATALEALATERDLFTYRGRLHEVLRDPWDLVPLTRARLRERLSLNALWQTHLKKTGKRTPGWVLSDLLSRGSWPKVRPLAGLIDAPIIRPDGILLNTPGYDPRTGLFYAPRHEYKVDNLITEQDGRAALHTLNRHFSSIPFCSPAHRSAFFAALLTPFASYRIGGPAPLFFFDAPHDSTPTVLADLVSRIVTGERMVQMEKPPSEREFRRRLVKSKLRDECLVLLDDAESYRGPAALKTALNHRAWVDGKERANDPRHITWYAASSNALLSRSVADLVLPIRINADVELPHDLEDRIMAARPEIVSAALTILQGYDSAFRPTQDVEYWDGFDRWVEHVANAIAWAGGADPVLARRQASEAIDDEELELHQFVQCFHALDLGSEGLTVNELIARLDYGDEAALAVLASVQLILGNDWKQPRRIGALLKRLRGKFFDDVTIERVDTDHHGFAYWSTRRRMPVNRRRRRELSQQTIAATRNAQPPPSVAEATAIKEESAPAAESSDSLHVFSNTEFSDAVSPGTHSAPTSENATSAAPASATLRPHEWRP